MSVGLVFFVSLFDAYLSIFFVLHWTG